ncbi:MAG: hypothetical protein NTV52_16455 [Acidobacteria bacterium]|nr:hypothetical protein [Acidobacteriota bacterium]
MSASRLILAAALLVRALNAACLVEFRRPSSAILNHLVLLCQTAKNEADLRRELDTWIARNGDPGTISQLFATNNKQEARASAIGNPRPFHDFRGFDKVIDFHQESGGAALRHTHPILRRFRIGPSVQYSYREGPETSTPEALFRVASSPTSWPWPEINWFNFSDSISMLEVYAQPKGKMDCRQCQQLAQRIIKLGLAPTVEVKVRLRTTPWFDYEGFPSAFKFAPVQILPSDARLKYGIFVPTVEEYYAAQQIACAVGRSAKPTDCVVSGNWNIEELKGLQ